MASCRSIRMASLMSDQRDELLRRVHTLWKAAAGGMATVKIGGPDYRALTVLTTQLNEFVGTVSEGKTNFGQLAGSAPTGRPQDWKITMDSYDEDVDAAIELCGGDERATIRSLLVLTQFLELEAFGEAGVQYRRKRLSR